MVFSRFILAIALAVVTAAQTTTPSYTLVAANGRRAIPYRASGSTELLSLDQLATIFDFRVQDDPQAGGVIVLARGQRVLLTPGQALVSISGRIVSLSGAVMRDGQTLYVPVDFLSRALGPATNQRIDVRRPSRLIILGDIRVPQVAPRFERIGPNGRLTIDVLPPAAHRTTREGNRLLVRFEADALDLGALVNPSTEFVGGARIDGPTLSIDLGPSAVGSRIDDADPARVVVDLLSTAAAAAPPAPRRPAGPPEPPPVVDVSPPGMIRTVAIDPGHGGEDAGARGAGGLVEKDLTLQVARRLKAAIESRLGLRVLLTRDGDEAVAIDRRTALANNNKADLLISLHANASVRPALRGAQVLSLSLEDYRHRAQGLPPSLPVPVVGGGTRLISAMPWDLAQIPYAAQSESLAGIVVKHLTERSVPLHARATDEGPLRVLVGANMPAVLIEMGFLTNADDERALSGGDVVNAIVEALVATITSVRNGVPATAPVGGTSEPQPWP